MYVSALFMKVQSQVQEISYIQELHTDADANTDINTIQTENTKTIFTPGGIGVGEVIATDRALFSSEKCWYLSYSSTKTYVVGTH